MEDDDRPRAKKPRTTECIDIHVKVAGAALRVITIDPTETVRSIKDVLAPEGADATKVRLTHKGKQLRDDKTLEDLDIGDGAILILTFETQGGGVPEEPLVTGGGRRTAQREYGWYFFFGPAGLTSESISRWETDMAAAGFRLSDVERDGSMVSFKVLHTIVGPGRPDSTFQRVHNAMRITFPHMMDAGGLFFTGVVTCTPIE